MTADHPSLSEEARAHEHNGWTLYSRDLVRRLADALDAANAELAEAQAEAKRLLDACSKQNDDISQTLGKALGYPWYKDDLKNFPSATEADGVCVGEHVAETLADEAAHKLAEARGEVEWRPIESAPKDGTWFVALENGETYPCEWHEDESDDEGRVTRGGWFDHFNDSIENPSHWLPAPHALAQPDAEEQS